MKNAVLVIMLLFGITAMAQRGERNPESSMKDLTPEQVATLQTKRMTLALDLTQAQQTKIQAVNLTNAKMRKSQMETRKDKKDKGELQRPTREERYARLNELLDYKIAQRAEMKKILSEEQFEKWTKMEARKDMHRKGKMLHKREARR